MRIKIEKMQHVQHKVNKTTIRRHAFATNSTVICDQQHCSKSFTFTYM